MAFHDSSTHSCSHLTEPLVHEQNVFLSFLLYAILVQSGSN